MAHNNITKKKEFKSKSSINRNLKVYKKFSKKQIAEYKLKCNDDSNHVGNWRPPGTSSVVPKPVERMLRWQGPNTEVGESALATALPAVSKR